MGHRGSTAESHVARLFKFEPLMCSVHSRTGQWACPATRAASCSAADCGRTASARSGCIGSIMRAPSSASYTTGISHLYSRSFGPPSADASVGCWRLRRRIRDALHLFSCPRWPTLIRRPEVPCTPEKGSNRPSSHHASPESATLRSLSKRLTLVTAVTSILLRHGRLRRERN